MRKTFLVAAVTMLWAGLAQAGPADVVKVEAVQESSGKWRFNVTVRHDDTGWEHYANQWDVLNLEDGSILGTRVLYHPHVDEQPFTRSLSGVEIPEGVTRVMLRAKDSKHGWGGREITLTLPKRN